MVQSLTPLLMAVLPVAFFLLALMYLDSYKLVKPRFVILLVVTGAAIAAACFWLNNEAVQFFSSARSYSRYGAPILEESLKALPLAYFIYRNRIGFLVDAAICGFAIGTGFALVENIYYLNTLTDSSLLIWIVRGFGTAIMHGGNSAIFALIAKALTETFENWAAFFPGLAIAIFVHALFNNFILSPVASTVAILLLLPALVILVFDRSEKAVQQWLGGGFDEDTQLLELIHSGEFGDSKIGEYLQSLREHFSGLVLADMLCYLRISVEIGMRAKGILLARENGFEVKVGPEISQMLEEVKFLEKSIGKTGKLALSPFLGSYRKDLWQLELLSAARAAPRK